MRVWGDEFSREMNKWVGRKKLSSLRFHDLSDMSTCLQNWLIENNNKLKLTESHKKWIEEEIMVPIKRAESNIERDYSEKIISFLEQRFNHMIISSESEFMTMVHRQKFDAAFKNTTKLANEVKKTVISSNAIVQNTIDTFIATQAYKVKEELLFYVSSYYIEELLTEKNLLQTLENIKSTISCLLKGYIQRYLEGPIHSFLYQRSLWILLPFTNTKRTANCTLYIYLSMEQIDIHIFNFIDKIEEKINNISESVISLIKESEYDNHTLAVKIHDFFASHGFTDAFLHELFNKKHLLEDYSDNCNKLLNAYIDWLDMIIKLGNMSDEEISTKLTETAKPLAVLYMTLLAFPREDDNSPCNSAN